MERGTSIERSRGGERASQKLITSLERRGKRERLRRGRVVLYRKKDDRCGFERERR